MFLFVVDGVGVAAGQSWAPWRLYRCHCLCRRCRILTATPTPDTWPRTAMSPRRGRRPRRRRPRRRRPRPKGPRPRRLRPKRLRPRRPKATPRRRRQLPLRRPRLLRLLRPQLLRQLRLLSRLVSSFSYYRARGKCGISNSSRGAI